MKKTLFLLLGVLVASMLPSNALRAQTIQVGISASTLDRAVLSYAKIYQTVPGQAYYVDASEVNPLSATAATAEFIDTMPSVALTISADGFHASQDVFSIDNGVIVLTDVNGRHYVIGNASRDQRDSGYFYGSSLFSSVVGGEYSENVYADLHIMGDVAVTVVDNELNYYSNIYTALELTTGTTLTLLKPIVVDHPVLITSDVTIQQSGKSISSTYASSDSALVVVDGANVSWFGYNATADFTGVAANLFDVNGGALNLRSFKADANGIVVTARGNASVTLSGCEIRSALNAPVISLFDAANVTVRNVAVGSSIFAQMDNAATGTLAIRDSTAAATTAAIMADAYFKDGDYRKYSRSLSVAAANAIDTVFLARTIAASTDSVVSNIVLDFAGNSLMGILRIDNEAGTVYLRNGSANYLTGTGAVDIANFDSVGSIQAANFRTVVIDNSRVQQILPASGANVFINGGKYGQNYSSYLAPRHAMLPNPDADAAIFPFKVFAGYAVTFHNWDNRGHDSVAIVCTDDNRIVPAPARPTFVGADTIYCSYWIDPTYNTPWNFLEDVLVSDTNLYAQWIPFNPSTEARYVVKHCQRNVAGTQYALRDIAYGVGTIGQRVVVRDYNTYAGFHCTIDSAVITSLSASGNDTVAFYYDRDTFNIFFNLGGGSAGPSFNTEHRYVYGATIVYPDTVIRPGYKWTGWFPQRTTVPAFDDTLYATFYRRSYPLTWTGFDTIVDYNGQDRSAAVIATYVDDNGDNIPALLKYTDEMNHVFYQPINVGTYIVTASPVDTNYRLVDPLQTTLTIRPVIVSVVLDSIKVEKIKEYDGTASVQVLNPGEVNINYDGNNLYPIITAKYTTAGGDTSYFVGSNKTIRAYMSLGGNAAPNYRLSPSEAVIATDGMIIEPMKFGPQGGAMGADGLPDDQGLEAQAEGFCVGETSGITYYLTSGSADQYKLEFSAEALAQGFVDVDWTALTPGSSTVDVALPAGAATGDYKVWLTLRRNVGGQTFDSPRLGTTFHVNLSKEYIKPIFSDVISIIDTCHCIDQSSVRWYHNGTYVGNGPYYREVGGLTGNYYATMKINGVQNRTCAQDNFAQYPDEVASMTVSIYPNPAVDNVTVRVENATEFTHTLRVMNVLGMTILDTAFEGDETSVDFSRYARGSYTVSVDGVVLRVIKK